MDKISVSVKRDSKLPTLCWLLYFDLGSGNVEIDVGRGVEIFNNAIVEGCWDGEFSVPDFDGKNLFGSAVEWNERSLRVFGSISLTDRICYAEGSKFIVVSNSLFAVIALIDGEFHHRVNYYKFCYAPIAGIDQYPTEFPIKHRYISAVYQLFHRNMEISASSGIKHWCKTSAEHFTCFQNYEKRLEQSICRIVENVKSNKRIFKVVPYVTLSSGYDSTAVAALARCAGVTNALLCTKSKPRIFDIFGGRYSDDGTQAANSLDLKVEYVDYRHFKIGKREILYIAPSVSTPETSFMPMAEYLGKTGSLGALFTGYHGDKIWDKNLSGKYINDKLIRGDMSGINISEARLGSGFFNVAVPFLFARSAESIAALSGSTELSRWSVGGEYDRPLARRIAEERGVLRGAFGQKKRAIIDKYPDPKNKILSSEFRKFMKERFGTSYCSFMLIKWYYFYRTRLLAKINRGDFVPRSKVDFPYWMWFWAAGRYLAIYKSKVRKTKDF